jgi:hypothetical protein
MKTINKQYHVLIGFVTIVLCSDAFSWDPPIGIPAPEFGIEETHYMYTNKTFDYGDKRGPYKDAGYGPYTHYLDNTHANATDKDNPFGTEDKPRLSVPLDLPPGSVVEIHGGPYHSETFNGNMFGVTGIGTADKPIFVRGYSSENKIVFKRQISVRGRYIIVENTLFNGKILNNDNYGYIGVWTPSAYISIRNSEGTNFDGGVSLYGTSPKSIDAGGHPDTCFTEDIVFYNNYIHDNGYPATEETGIQGIMVSGNSKRTWILDNTIINGAEDGIHVIYQYNKNSHHMPDGVFIGRNIIHHHGENAIDIKHSKNVIVSENIMYGYVKSPFSGGAWGDAIVLNDEGDNNSVPENHYIIFNEIYDCDIGIRAEYGAYIFGNVFHHIDSVGMGVRHAKGMYIINNTFYDMDRGIYNNGSTAEIYLYNNLISNTRTFDIKYKGDIKMEMVNNLFYKPGGETILDIGGIVYSGLNNVPTGTCVNCIEDDPNFISSDTTQEGFLKLQSPSPAINKGIGTGRVQELIKNFSDNYGLDISFDYDGVPRPFSSKWDIGAYECTTNVGINYSNSNNSISHFTILPTIQNSGILISYYTENKSNTEMKIFDLSGRQIRQMEMTSLSGKNTYFWNAFSDNGIPVSNSCYVLKLINNKQAFTRQFILKN